MTSKLSWKPGGNWNFQILWDCQVNWRNSWTHPAGSCNGNTRPEVYYTTQSALPYESTNHISHASQYATQQNSNFKKMPWLLSGKLFQMLHPQTEKGCIIVEGISVPPPKKKNYSRLTSIHIFTSNNATIKVRWRHLHHAHQSPLQKGMLLTLACSSCQTFLASRYTEQLSD